MLKWPVLHYGSVPRLDAERWDFKVYGQVASITTRHHQHMPHVGIRLGPPSDRD